MQANNFLLVEIGLAGQKNTHCRRKDSFSNMRLSEELKNNELKKEKKN